MKINLSGISPLSSAEDSRIERVKILILGSGPAGLAAALYAARADTNPVVLAGMELGGAGFVNLYGGKLPRISRWHRWSGIS